MLRIPVSLTLLLALSASAPARAEEPPPQIKMATEGRFDLTPDDGVGTLSEGAFVDGGGRMERLNWLPPPERDRGYVAHLPSTHRAWRPFAVAFVPAGSGIVTIMLKGVWEDSGGGRLFQEEVEWDDLTAEGATLENGDFETAGETSGWGGTGILVEGEADSRPRRGKRMARTWHDAPLSGSVKVTAGLPVVLRGFIRSVRPVDFVEMKRIAGSDSPAHRAAKRFRRGTNFGNWLEAPPGQDWGSTYTEADVAKVAAEGFDHIRLPVAWHHAAGDAPEFRLNPELASKVDAIVEAAVAHDISIILNIHHFDDFTSHPEANAAKFKALWTQIAEHYRDCPDRVAFELLNEPKDAATTRVLNPIYADVISAIRRSNPERTIFVGPGRWNSVAELEELSLPDGDDNLIVTVHCYEPFPFTHQATTFTTPEMALYRGVQFPGPPAVPFNPQSSGQIPSAVQEWVNAYNTQPGAANPCSPARLQQVVDAALEWSDYYGRPVHMGEFGVYLAADPESRANYCREFRMRLEKAGLGWAIWDWKASFRYLNPETGEPEPGMREALFPAGGLLPEQ